MVSWQTLAKKLTISIRWILCWGFPKSKRSLGGRPHRLLTVIRATRHRQAGVCSFEHKKQLQSPRTDPARWDVHCNVCCSKSRSSWNAKVAGNDMDYLHALGAQQNYNINVDTG